MFKSRAIRRRITSPAVLYGVLLALVAAVGIRWETSRHAEWAFDGYAYSIRAQLDAGIPYETARESAREAYRHKPALHSPVARYWYGAAYPQYWELFAPRAVYPWLCGMLWRLGGFDTMFWVSNAAFVAAVVLLYALLLGYGSPPAAALVTASIAILPEVRLIARSNLTDMTAFALWCAELLALLHYAKSGDRRWLAAYVVATIVLTFTRPLPYTPFCCGLALVVSGWTLHDSRTIARGAVVAAVAAVCALAVVAAGAVVHAPSLLAIFTQLRDDSALHALPLTHWYATEVARSSATFVVWLLESLAGPVAIVALAANARRTDVAPLVGALLSTALTIAVNPLPSDVPRVALLPILPAIGAGLMLAIRWPLRLPGRATIGVQ